MDIAMGVFFMIFGGVLGFFGVSLIVQWWDWTYRIFGQELGPSKTAGRVVGVLTLLGALALVVVGVLKLAGVI